MTPEPDLNGLSVRTHNPADAPKQGDPGSEIRARARVGRFWAAGQGRLSRRIQHLEEALPGWTPGRRHMPPSTAWRRLAPNAEDPGAWLAVWLSYGSLIRAVITTIVWAVGCAVATQKRAAIFGVAVTVLSAYWLTR